MKHIKLQLMVLVYFMEMMEKEMLLHFLLVLQAMATVIQMEILLVLLLMRIMKLLHFIKTMQVKVQSEVY